MKYIPFIPLCIITCFVIASCEKDPELNKVPVAEAGDSRTVQLPKDTVQLNGSGTDSDGSVVGYLWSKISGPNTPVIQNNGSASASIQGMLPGEYVFQLMVIDNMGASGVDSVKLTVLGAPAVTLTLQPSINPSETYIAGNSTSDQGSTSLSDEFGVFTWTRNSITYNMRTLLKFDLSSIPANATITSAKLSLYSHPNPLNGNHISPNFGTDNSMLIQRITSSWTTGSVLYTTQPSTTTSQQILIPATALPSMDIIDIDVKDLVGSMLGVNNYGFLFKLQTEVLYNSRLFCSSRYPDASKHPKLEIVYRVN